MSLAWHPAGRGRAGPPRGSGQPASHEPGRAATAPEQTPFVWDRAVGASGTAAPEPAVPASPRSDPRRGRGRAGLSWAGREAARHSRSERGPRGCVSPRAAQESGLPVGWRASHRCPPAHHGVPGPAQKDPPARYRPPSAPRRDPRPGLGSRWGRLGRNVPGQAARRGSRGRRRGARPWPGARWQRRGAARSPQPHTGCSECSVLSPHRVQ